MGSFRVDPNMATLALSTSVAVDIWEDEPANNYYRLVIRGDSPIASTARAEYSFNSGRIYLDGLGPYLLSEIPFSGILISSCIFHTGLFVTIDNVDPIYCASLGILWPNTCDNSPLTVANTKKTLPQFGVALPSIIHFLGLNNFVGTMESVNQSPGDNDSIFFLYSPTYSYPGNGGVNGAQLEGEYVLWSTQLTLTPSDALPGDLITLTDGANQLDQIVSLSAVQIDEDGNIVEVPIVIISQTPGQITFNLPLSGLLPGEFPTAIIGLLDGVEFDGSVLLGILQAIYADGSGIYTLVPNKTNDTLYDRSVTPSVTIDVKIPNPIVKIGLLP